MCTAPSQDVAHLGFEPRPLHPSVSVSAEGARAAVTPPPACAPRAGASFPRSQHGVPDGTGTSEDYEMSRFQKGHQDYYREPAEGSCSRPARVCPAVRAPWALGTTISSWNPQRNLTSPCCGWTHWAAEARVELAEGWPRRGGSPWQWQQREAWPSGPRAPFTLSSSTHSP